MQTEGWADKLGMCRKISFTLFARLTFSPIHFFPQWDPTTLQFFGLRCYGFQRRYVPSFGNLQRPAGPLRVYSGTATDLQDGECAGHDLTGIAELPKMSTPHTPG